MKKIFVFVSALALLNCARPTPPEAPVVVEVPPAPKAVVETPKKPAANVCSLEVIAEVVNHICCREACNSETEKCSLDKYLQCGERVLPEYFEHWHCPSAQIGFDSTCGDFE